MKAASVNQKWSWWPENYVLIAASYEKLNNDQNTQQTKQV